MELRRALETLDASWSTDLDLARLVHHAGAADDCDAIVRLAPAAARQAAALGAHREAAAHLSSALGARSDLSGRTEAELLQRRAYEYLLTDQVAEAIDDLDHALALRRGLGDRLGEAAGLRLLSEVLWCPGRTAEARETARAAIDVLESVPRVASTRASSAVWPRYA